jgi:hypothetical protein
MADIRKRALQARNSASHSVAGVARLLGDARRAILVENLTEFLELLAGAEALAYALVAEADPIQAETLLRETQALDALARSARAATAAPVVRCACGEVKLAKGADWWRDPNNGALHAVKSCVRMPRPAPAHQHAIDCDRN